MTRYQNWCKYPKHARGRFIFKTVKQKEIQKEEGRTLQHNMQELNGLGYKY